MRILYSLLCDHVEQRPDGKMDVHGMFHELFAPGFPAAQDRLVFALGLEWDEEGPGPRPLEIDLVDPSGSPVLTIRGETEVLERESGQAPRRTVLALPMEEIVFPEPGTYLFRLRSGGRTVDLAPLHLTLNPEAAAFSRE